MIKVLVPIVLLVGLGAGAILLLRERKAAARRQRERVERYQLEDTGETIQIAESDAEPGQTPRRSLEEVAAFLAPDPEPLVDEPAPIPVELDDDDARTVMTEDGELRLTRPPFEAREGLVLGRRARFASALTRRVPPWIHVCPRVRLDALVRPTSPVGQDPVEWARWRRRARLRAADLVLVDRRTWKPLLVLQIRKATDARVRAGGRDRMVGEILEAAGIPTMEVVGSMSEDWDRIREVLDASIIDTPATAHTNGTNGIGHAGWDASAAANLLRLDDEDLFEPETLDD